MSDSESDVDDSFWNENGGSWLERWAAMENSDSIKGRLSNSFEGVNIISITSVYPSDKYDDSINNNDEVDFEDRVPDICRSTDPTDFLPAAVLGPEKSNAMNVKIASIKPHERETPIINPSLNSPGYFRHPRFSRLLNDQSIVAEDDIWRSCRSDSYSIPAKNISSPRLKKGFSSADSLNSNGELPLLVRPTQPMNVKPLTPAELQRFTDALDAIRNRI